MVVMLFVGIFSSLRSMLVLTGAYRPGAKKEKGTKERDIEKENTDEGSQD
jgi:multisubunit Na+/H+ antiporter MnhG subunit